jgi:hypothetical protein
MKNIIQFLSITLIFTVLATALALQLQYTIESKHDPSIVEQQQTLLQQIKALKKQRNKIDNQITKLEQTKLPDGSYILTAPRSEFSLNFRNFTVVVIIILSILAFLSFVWTEHIRK